MALSDPGEGLVSSRRASTQVAAFLGNVRAATWHWLRMFPAARATTTWLAIITATHLVLVAANDRLDRALLLTVSTNLHNLQYHPVSVLLTSACFIESSFDYYWFIAMSVFVLAPLEHWIGTGRWLLALAIGHIGSTLVVAFGLLLLEGGEGRELDVGVSYGVRMLAAIYVYRWDGWRRWAYCIGLLIFGFGQVALNRTFTDWGHLIAVLFGLALGPLLVRGKPRPRLPAVASIFANL